MMHMTQVRCLGRWLFLIICGQATLFVPLEALFSQTYEQMRMVVDANGDTWIENTGEDETRFVFYGIYSELQPRLYGSKWNSLHSQSSENIEPLLEVFGDSLHRRPIFLIGNEQPDAQGRVHALREGPGEERSLEWGPETRLYIGRPFGEDVFPLVPFFASREVAWSYFDGTEFPPRKQIEFIPEPSTIVLAAIALLAFAVAWGRRRWPAMPKWWESQSVARNSHP